MLIKPRFLALLALAFIGCGLVPACTTVHVHRGPTTPSAASDDAERMGTLNVKDASGLIEALKTTEISGEHTSHSIPTDSGGDTASITSGALHVGDGTGDLTVDGAVTVSSSALPSGAATSANQTTLIGHVDGLETLLAGTINVALSNLTQSSSAAHSTSHNGIQGLTVRRDTPTASADSNGEYQPQTTDATGKTWVALHTSQTNAYYEVTALNDVATNASGNSAEIDLRGYREAWFECLFDGASAAAGGLRVWGCLVSGGCTSGSATERAYLLADVLSDAQITQTTAGDNELDVAYSAEGTQRVSFHLQEPKPYNVIRWSRTSGGDADGLTCRVFARAF